MADKIKCPNCGHVFDIEEALAERLEARLKDEYEKKLTGEIARMNSEKKKLEDERNKLKELKEKEEELLEKKLNEAISERTEKIRSETYREFENRLTVLKEENEKKSKENLELKKKELELLKKKKEIEEKKQNLELELKKKLIEEQNDIEEKARKKERESFELEKQELLKQIEDNKKLAEEMKRKAEQGSMQLQGEVQELAIEELLRNAYPFDTIKEVPKGIRGADSIQTVVNSEQKECGTIVYESKRTKNFSNGWIDKLKQDQVLCKADVAVLVTQTMPADMDRFGEKNGVWICTFQEVKSLSFVLREMLIKMQSVKSSEENKGDKMVLLYNYLTSNEFVQNIERIVENYDAMINQLNSEKRAMHKIWAEREKHIWTVQQNISALFGSIKGIAGKELDSTNVLELPDSKIEE